MQLKYILPITFGLIFSSSVLADSICYYGETIELNTLKEKARKGDIDSKIKLGDIYLDDSNHKEQLATANQFLNDAIKYGTPKQQMDAVSVLKEHDADQKRTFKLTKKLASNDNIYAQIELGEHYLNATGDSEADDRHNKKMGIKWLDRAATHADIPTVIEITKTLAKVHADDTKAKAIELGLKTANTGNAQAEYNMGELYTKWLGIKPDEAKLWYQKSAQQGYIGAQFELGKIILTGYKHVKGDYHTGMNILLTLANKNYTPAQCELIDIYDKQKDKQSITNAIQWAKTAYNNHDNCGVKYLGKIYTEGKVVPQNYATALEWYKRGQAQQQNSFTYEIQDTEKLIEKKKKQLTILQAAQKTNNPDLLIQYGQQLINDDAVENDTTKGILLQTKAANLGSTKAKIAIAKNYNNILHNHTLYMIWIYRAAKDGNAEAQYLLAQELPFADTKSNQISSITLQYYQKSIVQGYKPAIIGLANRYIQFSTAPEYIEKAKLILETLHDPALITTMEKNIPIYKSDAEDRKRYSQNRHTAFESAIQANSPEEYTKAQEQLKALYNHLQNEANACYEERKRKHINYPMCEHGLLDQPLYASIRILSGMISVKQQQSQKEINKGIQQLQENAGQSFTFVYTKAVPELFLAQSYMDGHYVPQDYQKAKDILEKLASYQGDGNVDISPATYLLGTIYQQGLGMQKNVKTATDYFHVACLLQNKDACHTLQQ